MSDFSKSVQQNIEEFLRSPYPESVKNTLRDLIQTDPEEVQDAFYTQLEFGTGGMRGVRGIGPNRMNDFTIGFATQGLASYLKKTFEGAPIRCAIAYDSRINSDHFARHAAEILAANGIEVLLFSALRPTPELSFTIREKKCQAGIVLTASHNPKEYSGYKVYWSDGAQITFPHDQNIISEIRAHSDPERILSPAYDPQLIRLIDAEIDAIYRDVVCAPLLRSSPTSRSQLCIVYTPLHGTGITLLPDFFDHFGFVNLHVVNEQAEPDGYFPTVELPNPEEQSAMEMAMQYAQKHQADVFIGTDPDSDRIGVGIRDNEGKYLLLNGNQIAALFFEAALHNYRQTPATHTRTPYTVKTVVTTELLSRISASYQMPCYETLSGFKWIAREIAKREEAEYYVIGGEESFGIMPTQSVRDKDAISSSLLLCDVLSNAKEHGKSAFDLLENLYRKHGFFYEKLLSLTQKGKRGKENIDALMNKLRTSPPRQIAKAQLVRVEDYWTHSRTDIPTGQTSTLDMPQSNVLRFTYDTGTTICARPSGTEPKIKFYFSVRDEYDRFSSYVDAVSWAEQEFTHAIAALALP